MDFSQSIDWILLLKQMLLHDRFKWKNLCKAITYPVGVLIVALNRFIERSGFDNYLLEQFWQDLEFCW